MIFLMGKLNQFLFKGPLQGSFSLVMSYKKVVDASQIGFGNLNWGVRSLMSRFCVVVRSSLD
jgi:hypothetical protein